MIRAVEEAAISYGSLLYDCFYHVEIRLMDPLTLVRVNGGGGGWINNAHSRMRNLLRGGRLRHFSALLHLLQVRHRILVHLALYPHIYRQYS